MATSFKADLELVFRATLTDTDDLSATPGSISAGSSLFPRIFSAYTDGTGSNQAKQLWYDRRSLASASEEHDLRGGVSNRFGTAITFALVKGLLIRIRTPSAGVFLTIGNATANQFLPGLGGATQTYTVYKNDIKDNPIDGWTCSATLRYLKVAATGTVDYDIVIWGTV